MSVSKHSVLRISCGSRLLLATDTCLLTRAPHIIDIVIGLLLSLLRFGTAVDRLSVSIVNARKLVVS